jgi:hypothetical protein
MSKTFVMLDITGTVVTGRPFLGEPTYRQGGVLIFAPEGADELPLRLEALVEAKIKALPPQSELFSPDSGLPAPKPVNPGKLPVVWVEGCPQITDKNLPIFVATARAAAVRLEREHSLPLSMIWVDTLSASATVKHEDDNAEAARVISVLRKLSDATAALLMVVDHFGKNPQTGTRGASSKEAGADAIFALLGDRSDAGQASNMQLCLRKVRGGQQGAAFPFRLARVDLGRDEFGQPIESCVIDWTGDPVRPSPGRHSRARTLFEDVGVQGTERTWRGEASTRTSWSGPCAGKRHWRPFGESTAAPTRWRERHSVGLRGQPRAQSEAALSQATATFGSARRLSRNGGLGLEGSRRAAPVVLTSHASRASHASLLV